MRSAVVDTEPCCSAAEAVGNYDLYLSQAVERDSYGCAQRGQSHIVDMEDVRAVDYMTLQHCHIVDMEPLL